MKRVRAEILKREDWLWYDVSAVVTAFVATVLLLGIYWGFI